MTFNQSAIETKLGVRFKNSDLLKEAFTHRSYLNEYPKWPVRHNERLEYLGDAVLELAISEELFARFPDFPEGQLTVLRASLVNYQMLGKVAGELGVESHIFMSKGERGDNQRAKEVILANAYEAIVGAMYLDQGFETVKTFIKKNLLGRIDDIVKTGSYKDAKSRLQEVVQEGQRITPTYTVIDESGPAHERVFRVGVVIGDKIIAEGVGNSKQEAEVEAARKALEQYGETTAG